MRGVKPADRSLQPLPPPSLRLVSPQTGRSDPLWLFDPPACWLCSSLLSGPAHVASFQPGGSVAQSHIVLPPLSNRKKTPAEQITHLCYVILKPLQSFLAFNEGVAGAFPQFHQQGFICSQELTSGVQTLHRLSDAHLNHIKDKHANTTIQFPSFWTIPGTLKRSNCKMSHWNWPRESQEDNSQPLKTTALKTRLKLKVKWRSLMSSPLRLLL